MKKDPAHLVGRDGTCIDDGSSSLHVGKSVFGDGEHGDDVDLKGSFDVFQIDLGEILLGDLLSGVVDQDVDSISMSLDVLSHDPLGLCVARN